MDTNEIEEMASVTRDFFSVGVSPGARGFTGCVLVVSDSGPEALASAREAFAREFPEASSGEAHASGPLLLSPVPESWESCFELARRAPERAGMPKAVVFAERRTLEAAGPEAYGAFDLCLAI